MGFFNVTTTNKCRRCSCGTCRCRAIAEADRREAQKRKRPHVCGAHMRNGGTCHKTVAHGERCTARH